MKKAFFFALLFSFLIPEVFSQQAAANEVANVTIVTFLNPGFSYEMKQGKHQSLFFRGDVSTISGIGYSSTFGFSAPFDWDPELLVNYRFYYNAEKRAEKGKRTDMNSMNYFTPVFRVSFPKKLKVTDLGPKYTRGAVWGLGAAWGMQRNYRKRFSLDFNAGLNYSFSKTNTETQGISSSDWVSSLDPIFGLNLGFWLNKRREE